MKFSILINSAPWSSPSAWSALQFAEAVLASGHEIYRLFFYQDGVLNSISLNVPPQDEEDIPARWQSLIEEHEIDAVVCAASALKRGVLDNTEAQRYEKNSSNIRPGFCISGLGQWIEALEKSDRVISFGN